ncbi:MAG: DUF1080 domain-containing protein [Pirellulaceae bacterium]|nr:DUF1080 domain-containing protein [Planctomycetaceae bacterium]
MQLCQFTTRGFAILFTLWACPANAQTIALFDGKTLNGWVTAQGEPVTKGWQVEDGAIKLDRSMGRGGNIFTDRQYGHFILDFEWKIAKGGNSGIKYKVKKFDGRILGCEYQIIDDEGARSVNKNSTASLYDVYAPREKHVRPVGEFNQSRIVVCGSSIQHWLNGHLVLTAHVGSDEWYAKKEKSKFNDVKGFGENTFGTIMLTDHNSDVWYRNMYLTSIQPKEQRTRRLDNHNRVLRRVARRRTNRRHS